MKNIFYKKHFEYFINRIEKNNHFRYSRFNDGELIAIIGHSSHGVNCDGHQYFPEMGKKLKDVLLNYKFNENYILESFDYWYNVLPHIKIVLHKLIIQNPELKFLNTDFIRISHEQHPDKFINLLNILKEKKIVIVGPSYLKKLEKFLTFRFIEVPIKNCYLEINRITKDIKKISDIENDVFFLLSASMPANIIIDNFNDNRNTYLDWGSVWDTFYSVQEYPFIKKRSTSNHEKYNKIYRDFLI
ncbi:MAG: hypothetical protein ACOC33_03425 [bacterium]